MYKNRLKKAGVSKNINRSEALAMARVKAWRDARGVTSEFWRHGRLVEQARLHRFVHLHRQEFRKMVAEDRHRRADEPIEALLPPHIVVLSPCNPSAGVAARLDTTEKMFMGFRDYMMAGGPGSPRPSSQVSTLSGSSPSSSVLLRSGQETTELHFMWRQMERNSKKVPGHRVFTCHSRSGFVRHLYHLRMEMLPSADRRACSAYGNPDVEG